MPSSLEERKAVHLPTRKFKGSTDHDRATSKETVHPTTLGHTDHTTTPMDDQVQEDTTKERKRLQRGKGKPKGTYDNSYPQQQEK
eukprot:1907022-Amphidinium_carterae.2